MPFGQDCEYADFDASVADNQDKDDPDAHCARLMEQTEDACTDGQEGDHVAKSIHVRRLESRVAHTAARFVEFANLRGLSVADLRGARLPWYEIKNQADADEPPTVLIYEEIGGSFGVSAEQFAEDLDAIDASEITVRINSPGGSVFDAIAIHNSLLHHRARVTVYVDSLAASAASVIAMAGDEVVMMPGSQMMIHDASGVEDGNASAMASMSTFLDRQSDNIAGMYRRRAGGELSSWRELMLDETWMFADEAVSLGLADRVQEHARTAPVDPDGLLSRSFDLSPFRYAGREHAPNPRRTSSKDGGGGMAVLLTRSSTDAERRQAARARTDAAGGRAARTTAPTGVSGARMAAFPARLRAKLVEHKGQQRYHVEGHASVVDVPYEMWDQFGPYMEIIDRDAFTKTLSNGPDVAFLVNHRGVTMARTTNDSLRLSMDDTGLAVEAWLNPKRQDVSDLVTAIEDRDVTEMSFAFMLDDGQWSPDFETFRISQVDIDRGDVSAVNYGANPYTDVAARSSEVLTDLEHLPAGAARAAVARLQARQDVSLPVSDRAAQLDEAAGGADEPDAPRGRSIAHMEALLEDF